MSPRSFQLFPRPGRSWLAKLTFPDGTSDEIDTHKKDQASAEKRAKFVLRHRIAKRRYYAREKLRRKGKPIPAELQVQAPGRRRADAAETPAPAPHTNGVHKRPATPIDAEVAAAKLRGLAGEGLGGGDGDGPPAPPAAELGGEVPPPEEIPPLPPPPPDGAIHPDEVIPPGTPKDGEMMAEMLATGICAGTIRGVRWVGDESTPPWEPAEPHQGSLKWLQEGLAGKLKKRLGDTVVGDGTKIAFGFLGLVISMVAGARPKESGWQHPRPAAPDTERDQDGPPAAPASAPTTPPTPAPAPPRHVPQLSANGISTAIGRFK